MRLLAALACALGLGWSASVAAAPPGTLHPVIEPPMQVYLVRSADAGCEPECPQWIAAQGRIEAGSVARFRSVLRQLRDRKVPVLIDSGGGRVTEALEIGRLARAKGLAVVVSRTLLTPCAPADTACRRRPSGANVRLGVPDPNLSKCASSCAFILAAGTRRLVGPTAYVGVHQVRSYYIYAKVQRTYRATPAGRQLVSERRLAERIVETRTPQKTYDQIRRYFAEMGIGAAIMPLILETPGDRLHWLTRAELQATGLATDWSDGAELLSVAAALAPPVITPGDGDGGAGAASTQAEPPK